MRHLLLANYCDLGFCFAEPRKCRRHRCISKVLGTRPAPYRSSARFRGRKIDKVTLRRHRESLRTRIYTMERPLAKQESASSTESNKVIQKGNHETTPNATGTVQAGKTPIKVPQTRPMLKRPRHFFTQVGKHRGTANTMHPPEKAKTPIKAPRTHPTLKRPRHFFTMPKRLKNKAKKDW